MGVQLYGSEPNLPLQEALTRAGASVLPVAPYVYASASDDAAVHELLAAMHARRIDAIAFTSQAQVDRLFAVGGEEPTRAALAATEVAAVGPVVASALQRRHVTVQAMPEASWSMKPLAKELGALLGSQVRGDTASADTR